MISLLWLLRRDRELRNVDKRVGGWDFHRVSPAACFISCDRADVDRENGKVSLKLAGWSRGIFPCEGGSVGSRPELGGHQGWWVLSR